MSEIDMAQAADRLASITPGKTGYADAVMAVYGFLPEGQLYRDVAHVQAELVRLEEAHHRRGVTIIEMSENGGAALCRAEKAEAEVVILREALEPFAATGAILDPKPKDDSVWVDQRPAPPLTFGHLRRAATVYGETT